MFSRLSLLAALVPFVSALVIETPTNFTSGGPAIITWTTTAGDNPVFSIELSNPTIFNQALALANNVDNTLGSISITLPIVPATSGYTLEAVNISNINDVFAQSGSFSVGETVSSSVTPSSSVPASGSVPATVSPASTSPFGSTISNSAKPSSSGSASASGASSASSAAASSFNGNGNGALSNLNFGMGSWAAIGLGAIFGVMTTL